MPFSHIGTILFYIAVCSKAPCTADSSLTNLASLKLACPNKYVYQPSIKNKYLIKININNDKCEKNLDKIKIKESTFESPYIILYSLDPLIVFRQPPICAGNSPKDTALPFYPHFYTENPRNQLPIKPLPAKAFVDIFICKFHLDILPLSHKP